MKDSTGRKMKIGDRVGFVFGGLIKTGVVVKFGERKVYGSKTLYTRVQLNKPHEVINWHHRVDNEGNEVLKDGRFPIWESYVSKIVPYKDITHSGKLIIL